MQGAINQTVMMFVRQLSQYYHNTSYMFKAFDRNHYTNHIVIAQVPSPMRLTAKLNIVIAKTPTLMIFIKITN